MNPRVLSLLALLCLLIAACAAPSRSEAPTQTPPPVVATTAPEPAAVAPQTTSTVAPAESPTAPAGASPTEAAPAPEPTAAPASDFDWVFDNAIVPLNLDVSLDATGVVTAVIPVAGGEVTATGADGTRYTLTVPANALANATEIRLTPVASLGGLPAGDGPALAVQLAPEGLLFAEPAMLTIEPATPIPVDEQILFGYHGDGQGLFLAAPAMGEAIQIQVIHFSGYGVQKGFLADLEPVRQRLGGSAMDRLATEFGALAQQERVDQLMGRSDGTFADRIEPLLDRFEQEVLIPRIQAAEESCANARVALETILSYMRQIQLMGLRPDAVDAHLNDVAMGLLDSGSLKCLEEEYELCRDEHLIHRIIPLYFEIAHLQAVLGLEDGQGQPAIWEPGFALIERCLRFELEFESTASFTEGPKDGYESGVSARVPIRIQRSFTLSGSSALVNTFFQFRVDGCNVTSNRGGGTFEVEALSWDATTTNLSENVGYVRDITVAYYPGRTTESFRVNCEGMTLNSPPSPHWTAVYIILHVDEVGRPGSTALVGLDDMWVPDLGLANPDSFTWTDWRILADELYAEKEWRLEDAANGVLEIGFVRLHHRPG